MYVYVSRELLTVIVFVVCVTCCLCHLQPVSLAACVTCFQRTFNRYCFCSLCHLLPVPLTACATCSLCHLQPVPRRRQIVAILPTIHIVICYLDLISLLYFTDDFLYLLFLIHFKPNSCLVIIAFSLQQPVIARSYYFRNDADNFGVLCCVSTERFRKMIVGTECCGDGTLF